MLVLTRPQMLAGPARICASSSQRVISSSVARRHDNPLGIPRRQANPPPTLPRRGVPQRSRIRGVKHVVVVASGKGGVGKSTVAANLALAMLQTRDADAGPPRVGLLDLDIFGPSVPKLMGLEDAGEPALSAENKLVPLQNHGVKTMSIGYLLPPDPTHGNPVVWRGLMVQKAVQQVSRVARRAIADGKLLFDVDWTDNGAGDLDVLVVDMPPGTGDVQLSLGQLVVVDGAVVVSTPQDVALVDARKGVGMFRKVDIPIVGLLLNMAYFRCGQCAERHALFGSRDKFARAAGELELDVLGEVPLVPGVSNGGDAGRPVMVQRDDGGEEVRETMRSVGRRVWDWLASRPYEEAGTRG